MLTSYKKVIVLIYKTHLILENKVNCECIQEFV